MGKQAASAQSGQTASQGSSKSPRVPTPPCLRLHISPVLGEGGAGRPSPSKQRNNSPIRSAKNLELGDVWS